ncbi:MAG: CheY-like chemotaxis protein [Paraglaciecola sp.]|jgi:CheY-like chemotaxis protein
MQMRILVVDGDSLNRFLLIHIFEHNGYADCYKAQSGHEAISLAQRVNLFLLGNAMGDVNGYDISPIFK